MADHTQPDDSTRREERREAQSAHDADRQPTAEEERAAEQAGAVDDATRRAYEEATETGANVKGEGEI